MQEVDENVNEAQVERPQTPVNNYNIISPTRRGGQGKKFLLVLIILLLVVGGGIFIFARGQGGESEEITPTPTPTETLTPTPTSEVSPTPTGKPTPTTKPTATPTKKVTKSISVRVLNGSGVTGAAKAAADYLGNLGYEIVGVGNAETQNLDLTTIQIKKDKESFLAQLKIDLETKYALGTTSATLSATESADAIVTVGKK